nr:YdcF family protein [uncultured Noviherbaspirillum sp.]
MSNAWLLTNAFSALLLPPLNLLILAAAGILARHRWPRAGPAIALLALALLAVLSTTAGARLLIRPLEAMTPPLTSASAAEAQAIVVLGGGRRRNAPEYEGQDVPRATVLARLRYAVRLHRQTGLPMLVTGGSPDVKADAEAELMARVLRDDFNTPARWVEGKSDNTAQNARYAAVMLRQAGISHVLLVTDALHMPRSRRVFAQAGLTVIPAPTSYLGSGALIAGDFIPGGGGLSDTHYAMHEWIGLLWYRLAHRQHVAIP